MILGFIVLLFILFFAFKGKMKDFIQSKIKNKQAQKAEEDDYIFLPIGMTRTFNIGITIEEAGGGRARLIINKKNIVE